MPLRPCLGSRAHPPGHTLARGARCPDCKRDVDNTRSSRRGTTKQRGLSGEHAKVSKLYKRNDLPCSICGEHGTQDNPITAGHIVARANGGTNHKSNYQPECLLCNSAKGAR